VYTASSAFLDALVEAGISHLFVNFGSDHPALIEALAEGRAQGRRLPSVITCPTEMVALSCAHGYAQVSGKPQAVLVHVECGTQSLAGAIHNADKGRVPVLIFAGSSPFTQEQELRGSRNEYIHWIQDVHDQRGIVRGYMRYDNEIRSGRNIKQIVHRAMQFACSDPKGPVYLVAAREVMEEEVPPVALDIQVWQPVTASALPEESATMLARALEGASRPLIVTTYAGRNVAAVQELMALCERLGVGVVESVPNYVNLPRNHSMYLGNYWNQPRQNEALAEADVVLVIDSDVPWISKFNRPAKQAAVYHIDCDPLKAQMPLWYINAMQTFRADAATALKQINRALNSMDVSEAVVAKRRAHYSGVHEKRETELLSAEEPDAQHLTISHLLSRVRQHIDDHTIVINEGITNYQPINDHLRLTRPGAMFASGAGSLGWNGGAAIGAKLAEPESTVVAICGDGSYMFSIPSTVHWLSRQYGAPFLQIVLNNRGWRAPKFSALAMHPDGYASRANSLDVSFDPPPDYGAIATAAGGTLALTLKEPADVDTVLTEAFHTVRVEKRSVVIDAWLPHL
jgi:acetolactate synthase I/II/III large subunit